MALPGINLSLDQRSDLPFEGMYGNWYERAIPLTVRERVMLDVMATLKNKSNWEGKVLDEAIVSRWRSEVCAAGDSWRAKDRAQTGELQSLAPRDAQRQKRVSKAMFQYCIAELRSQAPIAKARGFTEVLDANAAVYISDTAVNHDTKMALRLGVFPLENVRDALKDWHPGSNGNVLDLVHPSLYPLIYGTSRFFCESEVSLEDCAQYCGKGEIVPALKVEDVDPGYSSKHQWLPCEVSLDDTGNAAITSYINNLHPTPHKPLYTAVEQVITKAVPMWKLALQSTLFQYADPRMKILDDGYDHDAADADYDKRRKERKDAWQREKQERLEKRNQKDTCDDDNDDDDADSDDDDDNDDWDGSDIDDYFDPYQDQYIQLPDPDIFENRERKSTEEDASKFEQMFADNKLQVIVKLANIQLTPEKPSYDGGSWHIEGLQNEHIRASALYYYDSANVTDSYLAFREAVDPEYLNRESSDRPTYEQHHYHALWEIFGLYGEDNMGMTAMQVIGQVKTSENRLLVFPNVLQHRVEPFQLADATQPGHRKILALFLVDPNIRIPSTANVPPQQLDWWAKKIHEQGLLAKLPTEISELVYDKVEGFPLSFEQAKEVRAELMAERGAHNEKVADGSFLDQSYCFCEH